MQRISAFWSGRDKSRSSISSNTSAIQTTDLVARHHARENYWPTNLERETEKAARILHSFCTEGYLSHQDDAAGSRRSSVSTTQSHIKKKIPPRIVQNAVGLAIFSCMRSGLWKSGSGGSGILIARKSDGRWSPPSGLLLHTAALGFVIGVDVYDCVLVINSIADLEVFTRARTTLGADVELAVGPVMSAGHMENDFQMKDIGNTVLTYVKARGEHRPVNIDGSLVAERASENNRFYGRDVSILDILAGHVPPKSSAELEILYEVIKSAEGRVDFDAPLIERLALQPAPGDAVIENPAVALSPLSPGRPAFGVPDNVDPDPFGVKALEMAGLEIREAGSNKRPPSSQFEYNPSPTSPLFGHFNNRQSIDTIATQNFNSNRASYTSNKTTFSRMTDAFTQTTVDTRGTTPTSDDGRDRGSADRLPVVMEPVEVDYTQIDDSAVKRWSQKQEPTHEFKEEDARDQYLPKKTDAATDAVSEELNGPLDERDEDADDEDDDSDGDVGAETLDEEETETEDESDVEDDDEEEPVVFEVYEAKAVQPARAAVMSSQATQITHAKGALVNIPKRIAPPVPPRSPARSSRTEFGEIPLKSPLRNSFQSVSTRTSRTSTDEHELRSLDGAMSSASTEVAADATTTNPAAGEAVTGSERRLSTGSHQDGSIYDSIIESRLSMEDMPKTPSTTQTSGQTSSGDEQEPRTPKPEDELTRIEAHIKDGKMSQKISREHVRSLEVETD